MTAPLTYDGHLRVQVRLLSADAVAGGAPVDPRVAGGQVADGQGQEVGELPWCELVAAQRAFWAVEPPP